MSILVLNAGSASLKFGLFEAATCAAQLWGTVDWARCDRQRARLTLRPASGAPQEAVVAMPDSRAAGLRAVEAAMAHGPIEAVGHRVVHGGTRFDSTTRIIPAVKAAIAELAEVAPLHNPPALAAIEAAEAALPGVPQVAAFDTAFFAHLPPRAFIYPLPYEWHERWGVRRFGFHGLSNAYCALRAPELLGQAAADLRLVTCHLGGGCSATAVRGGAPVTTTMGFSPLEGLVMGTRCGSVDPGLLMWLQRRHGLTPDELDEAMNHRSGLAGISGISNNLSEIEALARQGHARAQLAFDIFADRIRAAVGALAVTMGGLDALIFTARIGETFPGLRAAVCDGLACLGARLDADRNAACDGDADIATADSAARILVVHTREEWMIARETLRLTSRPGGPGSAAGATA